MDKTTAPTQVVAPAAFSLAMPRDTRFRALLSSTLLVLALPASAMQAMDDSDLAAVSGKDGLTVLLDGNMQADAIRATFDATPPLGSPAKEATVSANGLHFMGVGANGVVGGDAGLEFTLDANSEMFALSLATTNRVRLRTDSLTVSSADYSTSNPGNPGDPDSSDRSYGTWAFDFDAKIELANQGIFSMSYDQAYLLGQVTDADLFYSQDNNAWMAMHDFNLLWEIPEGILGISNEGIVHRAGTPGVDSAANVTTDPNIINLMLDFEYILGQQGTNEFEVTSDARGLMHFGWLGSIKNAEVKWMPGGVWYVSTGGVFDPYGANATTSNGLRFSSQWDFVTLAEANALGDPKKEFRWRLGETADVGSTDKSRINFELGDWTIWGTRTPAKPSAHYFPLIALDVISGKEQGPGGLCWGHGQYLDGTSCSAAPNAQFIDVIPGDISNYGITETDENALAIIVRGGQLQSYSRKVRLLEQDTNGDIRTDTDPNRPGEQGREFNWGLIYSLANVSANIYLYPGITRTGSTVTDNQGVIADILVMSQTLNGNSQGHNWDHGTHLMIADTEANMGIGFMSSSFVVAGNDTRILVKPQVGNDYYSGGLDFFSPQSRFNYRATFGGGLLPGHPAYAPGSTTRAQTVTGTNIDLNLEGMVNLRFSPSDPNEANNPDGARNYLGYSGALRLGSNAGSGMQGATSNVATCGTDGISPCGSYLSLAEPSQPDAAIKLANITGDFAFTEGRVDVVGTGEIASSPEPKMVLANNIKLGYAAKSHIDPILTSAGITPDVGLGRPVMIDNIMLGSDNLGRMVIPSAQIYSSITLEPQSAAVPFSP